MNRIEEARGDAFESATVERGKPDIVIEQIVERRLMTDPFPLRVYKPRVKVDPATGEENPDPEVY